MTYRELRTLIRNQEGKDFTRASSDLESAIFSIPKNDLVSIITEIGVIPEDIPHDSSEEKIYTKASDILFAKALKEMGLQVAVLRERADSADIVAKSVYHGYSLVGDAKAFRLSRTAKNAKDFKVDSMRHWRGSNDFSVLACPYFQYPKSQSQVYKEALDGNVCLFSWEYLYLMLREGVTETADRSFKNVWNQSAIIAKRTTCNDAKRCFLDTQNSNIVKLLGIRPGNFTRFMDETKRLVVARGNEEIAYYRGEIERVRGLDRKTAVEQLLKALKIESRIETIQKTIDSL